VLEELLTAGIWIALLAFVAEYVDSTLGMGYGTTLTPALLALGYEPMQVVPAVLMSELFTGLLAGLAHHRAGNADFRPKRAGVRTIAAKVEELGLAETLRRGLPRDLRIVLVIAACSVVGTVVAVAAAVTVSSFHLKLYIGLMVLSIGVMILLRRRRRPRFSWKRITGIGLLAAFNKGLSGGGYGPLVCGGQILSGVDGKKAVAITSLAEGLVCAVGFTAYVLTGRIADWGLFPYLCIGALLSVPLSALTVKRAKAAALKLAIGGLTTVLGGLTLAKLLL